MTKKLWQPFFTADVLVPHQKWAEMEAAGNVSLSPAARNRLLSAMTSYRESIDGYDSALRTGSVRRVLEKAANGLSKGSDALAELLVPHSPVAEAALREIRRAAAVKYKVGAGPDALAELHAQIGKVVAYTKSAVAALPDDKGASGDPYVGGFLLVATAIFHESGGKGTYTPAATAFLRAACEAAGLSVQSDASLAQAVKLAKAAGKKVRAKAAT